MDPVGKDAAGGACLHVFHVRISLPTAFEIRPASATSLGRELIQHPCDGPATSCRWGHIDSPPAARDKRQILPGMPGGVKEYLPPAMPTPDDLAIWLTIASILPASSPPLRRGHDPRFRGRVAVDFIVREGAQVHADRRSS